MTGNSVMTCPTPAGNCTAARAGGNFNDNDFNMGFLDADTDPATTNSSFMLLYPLARRCSMRS